jgi:hypothetical protein
MPTTVTNIRHNCGVPVPILVVAEAIEDEPGDFAFMVNSRRPEPGSVVGNDDDLELIHFGDISYDELDIVAGRIAAKIEAYGTEGGTTSEFFAAIKAAVLTIIVMLGLCTMMLAGKYIYDVVTGR